MTGVTTGANIVFVVTWKNSSTSCNSLTEWTGTISGSAIYTSWQLAFPNMASGNIQIQYDSDTFQRLATMWRSKIKRKRLRGPPRREIRYTIPLASSMSSSEHCALRRCRRAAPGPSAPFARERR